jgi:hypothetical protein
MRQKGKTVGYYICQKPRKESRLQGIDDFDESKNRLFGIWDNDAADLCAE